MQLLADDDFTHKPYVLKHMSAEVSISLKTRILQTGGRGWLRYVPTYLAYRLRATAVSVVPLMIARPSGKRVSS